MTRPEDQRRCQTGRRRALSARPVRTQALRLQQRENGGVLVVVRLPRPRWQRWLGAGETCERTFGLDAVGREVYEACDGRRSVRRIVEDFAAARKVGPAEAELSVTAFLRTLTARGLVVLAMDGGSPDDDGGEAGT